MTETPRPVLRAPAVVSLALLAFPGLFLLAVILKYGLGHPGLYDPLASVFESPVGEFMVLLSPAVALLLSALAVLHVRVRHGDGTLVSTITVRLRVAHLVALALSAAFLTVFLGYWVVENIHHAG